MDLADLYADCVDFERYLSKDECTRCGAESCRALVDFLTMIDEDDALSGELGAALEGDEDQANAMVEAASGYGFEFTAEEYAAVIDSLIDAEDQALGDEELESVAGAAPAPPPCVADPERRHRLRNVRLHRGRVRRR